MICPLLGSPFPKTEASWKRLRQAKLESEIRLSRLRSGFILLVVPQHLAQLYRPNTFQILDWIQTTAYPKRRSIAFTKRGRAAMAIRNRRKEDGSGNTWIKWLLLFWFIGAGYVAFLWYIGFSGRDLGVRAIGVTLIIFGIVGYALIKTLLRRGQPKLSQTGELPRIRDGRSPQVIVIMIVSLAALGLLIPWGYKKFRPFPHEEINKTVEELNQRVMYWRMEPSQIILQPSRQLSGLRMQTGLRSLGCAEQPKAQFVISINNLYRDNAYLFDACEYTLETGGDLTKVTTSNICDFINERYTGKYPLLEAMREASIEISGPRGIDTQGRRSCRSVERSTLSEESNQDNMNQAQQPARYEQRKARS